MWKFKRKNQGDATSDGNPFILVGLGNPTRQYAATRHNIGFDVITRISDDYHIPLDMKKHKAICGKGRMGKNKVVLAQPQTYMNLSGECVIALLNYYKVKTDKLILIYDDVSLDVGQLRIRMKGSAGGHNGVKSVISHLGTQEFTRIKFGVGEKPKGWDLSDYVLGRFSKEEEPVIRDSLKKASEACMVIMEEGLDVAMNRFNGKGERET